MSQPNTKNRWLVPALAGAALAGAVGLGVYFLVRGRNQQAQRSCTSENCTVPFSCQGTPEECLINPTNRRPAETTKVPRESNTARMLGLQADRGTFQSRAGSSITDAEGIFQTPAPEWTFISNGMAKVMTLKEWSYDDVNDLVRVTLVDSNMVEEVSYLNWVSEDSFEQMTDPQDANPVLLTRMTAPFCDPRLCVTPFMCTSTPGECVINPTNRKPGETEPVPPSSLTAQMLGLLVDPAAWLNDPAETAFFETKPIFGSPVERWIMYLLGTPIGYNIQYWSYDSTNDLLAITFRNDEGDLEATIYMRYVSPTSFEYLQSPEGEANLFRRVADNYCGLANCSPPFLCDAGVCVINPQNRSPSDTDPVPRGSPAALTLSTLMNPGSYVDQATQLRLLEITDSVFATPLPSWNLIQNGETYTYAFEYWSYSAADPEYITVSMNIQGSSYLWKLKWSDATGALQQIPTNDPNLGNEVIEWIPYGGEFCTPATCPAPFMCQGAPPLCLINPANRLAGETTLVPKDSNTAQMLLLLSTNDQWLQEPTPDALWDTQNVFQTSPAPPLWVRYQNGIPVEYEIMHWSYTGAVDLLEIRLIDNENNQISLWFRYLGPDVYETLQSPSDPSPLRFRRSSGYCGSANCTDPFFCQGSPATCLINPANRKPGETTIIPRNSNGARMLKLLSTQAQWIDNPSEA
jgi:hypothetical protein